MSPYDKPADNIKVVLLADLSGGPVSFTEIGGPAVLHIEAAGGGVLAVRLRPQAGKTAAQLERVLTVTDGQEIPLFVEAILDATTVDVDGYTAPTTTDVAKIRAYLWD